MPPYCSLPWSCTGFYFCFGFLCDMFFYCLQWEIPNSTDLVTMRNLSPNLEASKLVTSVAHSRPRFFSCSSSSILHGSAQLFSRAKVGGHEYTRPLWLMLPSREEELCLPGILFILQEVSSLVSLANVGPPNSVLWLSNHHECLGCTDSEHFEQERHATVRKA